ncbi:MAG: hypothetical protein AAB343_03605 [Patescibacteria group bacterium]
MKFRREVPKVLTKRKKKAQKRRERVQIFKEAQAELSAIDAELEAFVRTEEDWGVSVYIHDDFLRELEDRRSEECYGDLPQDVGF